MKTLKALGYFVAAFAILNKYMGYDSNLNGDSYSITRNSDGMKGVLTIDNQANMQWYYYDAEGIHTN